MDEEGVYLLGDGVRLENTWKVPATAAGTPTDPTTVTLRIEDRDGNVSAYAYPAAVSKVSVGRYRYDYVPAKTGRFTYRWEGTGAAQAAAEGTFYVRPSAVIANP